MKKWIQSVIAVLLASICLLPSAAFAADNTDTVPEAEAHPLCYFQ